MLPTCKEPVAALTAPDDSEETKPLLRDDDYDSVQVVTMTSTFLACRLGHARDTRYKNKGHKYGAKEAGRYGLPRDFT